MTTMDEWDAEVESRIAEKTQQKHETDVGYVSRRLTAAIPRRLAEYEVDVKKVTGKIHHGEMLPPGYEVTVVKPYGISRFAKKYSPEQVKSMMQAGLRAIGADAEMLGETPEGAWIGERSFQLMLDAAKEITPTGSNGDDFNKFAQAAHKSLTAPTRGLVYFG